LRRGDFVATTDVRLRWVVEIKSMCQTPVGVVLLKWTGSIKCKIGLSFVVEGDRVTATSFGLATKLKGREARYRWIGLVKLDKEAASRGSAEEKEQYVSGEDKAAGRRLTMRMRRDANKGGFRQWNAALNNGTMVQTAVQYSTYVAREGREEWCVGDMGG